MKCWAKKLKNTYIWYFETIYLSKSTIKHAMRVLVCWMVNSILMYTSYTNRCWCTCAYGVTAANNSYCLYSRTRTYHLVLQVDGRHTLTSPLLQTVYSDTHILSSQTCTEPTCTHVYVQIHSLVHCSVFSCSLASHNTTNTHFFSNNRHWLPTVNEWASSMEQLRCDGWSSWRIPRYVDPR